jgi:hypothetical protein
MKSPEMTSRTLTAAMFEELELLREGKSTPQQAAAKAKIAQVACNVARLEMDYARFVAATRSDEGRLKALPMG